MRTRPGTGMVRLLIGIALVGLAVVGCAAGGGGAGGGGGPLDGATFRVGSKEFTEQLILGQITIQALEASGARVEDKTGIQGTTNVRKALTSNEIDMYWDYTGTGWTNLLGHTTADAPKDPAQLFQTVAAEDLQRNQVKWLDPAPLNNTYALATAQGRDQELNVHSISDYARLANSDPGRATMCAATEFLTRDDGWPGLQKAYGFNLPASSVRTVDLGVIYTQIPSGQQCNFGEVFETDGRIAAQNLRVLTDDKNYFVAYNGALTIRNDAFTKYPALADVFRPISQKLTTETLRRMNQEVDVNGALPEEVAKKFLQDNGFTK